MDFEDGPIKASLTILFCDFAANEFSSLFAWFSSEVAWIFCPKSIKGSLVYSLSFG